MLERRKENLGKARRKLGEGNRKSLHLASMFLDGEQLKIDI